ncbi:MAG: FMN-binding protein, partial [Chloroflexi bacterium]|nr:FMN-binding protein [Chloroflexota bacterium]
KCRRGRRRSQGGTTLGQDLGHVNPFCPSHVCVGEGQGVGGNYKGTAGKDARGPSGCPPRDRRGSEHEEDDHGARPASNAQPLRPNAVLAQPSTATPSTDVAPPTTAPQPAVAPQSTAAPKSATPVIIPTIKPTLAPTVAPATGTRLRDGSYNSSVISTNWGPIEMKIVVSGGKITDVVALQYPSSRSRSLQISNYALPAYEDEVIRTQNENVNSISGATQTARGFRAAIASAIQKAS